MYGHYCVEASTGHMIFHTSCRDWNCRGDLEILASCPSSRNHLSIYIMCPIFILLTISKGIYSVTQSHTYITASVDTDIYDVVWSHICGDMQCDTKARMHNLSALVAVKCDFHTTFIMVYDDYIRVIRIIMKRDRQYR